MTEAYRILKNVYDWDPPVLCSRPEEVPFPTQSSIDNAEPIVGKSTRMAEKALEIASMLSERCVSREEVEKIVFNGIKSPEEARELAYRALKHVLKLTNPVGAVVFYCANVREVLPQFLKTGRERGTMTRFLAKILVGRTEYNLDAAYPEEYQLLHQMTWMMFDSEPPAIDRVLDEILHNENDLAYLVRNPSRLINLVRISLHYQETLPITRDIALEMLTRMRARESRFLSKVGSEESPSGGAGALLKGMRLQIEALQMISEWLCIVSDRDF